MWICFGGFRRSCEDTPRGSTGSFTIFEKFAQLFLCCRFSLVEDDDGHDLLTPLGMRDSDDGCVLHRRMGKEDMLDFARENIETTTYDHVLLSAHDTKKNLLIKTGNVS